jgi:hypothetical protein
MRSPSSLLIAGVIATTIAGTVAACASSPSIPPASLTAGLTAPRQIVRIYNHSFDNLEISAIRAGSRRVLGVISAAQDGTLVLSEDMLDVDGRVQLVARIAGGRGEMLMPPTRVAPGNYISWSLEHDFAHSSVATFPM